MNLHSTKTGNKFTQSIKSNFTPGNIDELISDMQDILVTSKTKQDNSLSKAIDYLNSTIDIFEDVGAYLYANRILKILTKIASDVWKDEMPGGLADKKTPKNFNQKTIEMGMKIEMEHTNDRHLATEIVMDHLIENPKYYDYLEKMEYNMNKSPLPKGKKF